MKKQRFTSIVPAALMQGAGSLMQGIGALQHGGGSGGGGSTPNPLGDIK